MRSSLGLEPSPCHVSLICGIVTPICILIMTTLWVSADYSFLPVNIDTKNVCKKIFSSCCMLYFFCAWEACLRIKLKYLEVLTETFSLPEQFLLQCAEQLPHKIPFFGVLVCKYIYSKAYSILLLCSLFLLKLCMEQLWI